MERKKYYVGLVLLFLLAIAGGIFFWKAYFFKSQSWSQVLSTWDMLVYTGNLAIKKFLVLTGTTQVQVLAQVNGKLSRILLAPGEAVKWGQPILLLQDSIASYESQVEYAKKRLDQTMEAKQFFLSWVAEQWERSKQAVEIAEKEFLSQQTAWETNQVSDASTENTDQLNKLLNAETTLKKAMLSYDSFLSNQKQRLVFLDDEIASAKLKYEEMLNQYAQLTTRASISGVLGEVFVQLGETITKGDLLFHIHLPLETLETTISTDEYLLLNTGSIVNIATKEKALTGEILSILPHEDRNGLFTIRIRPSEYINPTGEVAVLYFPIDHQGWIKLPRSLVKKKWKKSDFCFYFFLRGIGATIFLSKSTNVRCFVAQVRIYSFPRIAFW